MYILISKIIESVVITALIIRWLYLFIKSRRKIDAKMGMYALNAMMYALMVVSSVAFYYGKGNFIASTKAVTFSSWKDIVFIVMFVFPVVLTVIDIYKQKREGMR